VTGFPFALILSITSHLAVIVAIAGTLQRPEFAAISRRAGAAVQAFVVHTSLHDGATPLPSLAGSPPVSELPALLAPRAAPLVTTNAAPWNRRETKPTRTRAQAAGAPRAAPTAVSSGPQGAYGESTETVEGTVDGTVDGSAVGIYPEYPRYSRKMGQQGRAVHEVRFGSDGAVVALHLVESSGFSLLDSAARTAIHRAIIPKWAGHRKRVAIRFSLSR
jgi:periplasmic protein TonB